MVDDGRLDAPQRHQRSRADVAVEQHRQTASAGLDEGPGHRDELVPAEVPQHVGRVREVGGAGHRVGHDVLLDVQPVVVDACAATDPAGRRAAEQAGYRITSP